MESSSLSRSSEIKEGHTTPSPSSNSTNILISAAVVLFFYVFFLAMSVYLFNPDGYSGIKTMILSSVFVFATTIAYLLHVHKSFMLAIAHGSSRVAHYFFAAGVVILCCVGTGTIASFYYYFEDLGMIDSFYLSVISVTTIGYGNRAFKTFPGRLFVSFWLLVSTLTVARAILFLARSMIDKRRKRIARDFLSSAAGINHNGGGFSSKTDFAIYKLLEKGKISEKRILELNEQFKKLDPNNTGTIKLPDYLVKQRAQ